MIGIRMVALGAVTWCGLLAGAAVAERADSAARPPVAVPAEPMLPREPDLLPARRDVTAGRSAPRPMPSAAPAPRSAPPRAAPRPARAFAATPPLVRTGPARPVTAPSDGAVDAGGVALF